MKYILTNNTDDNELGLTKRELFAAMAMQGLIAYNADRDYKPLSIEAIGHADSLIYELNNNE